MLKRRPLLATSYEDIFLERYALLLAQVLRLAAHDRALAENILHDAFIQFTLAS